MKRAFGIGFIAILLITGVMALNLLIFAGMPSGDVEQSLRIEHGTPLGKIARELEARHVVSNAILFKAYVLFLRSSGKIRAGDFTFPPRLLPRQVLALLIKGDFAKSRITIPEGWTAYEIAEYLQKLNLVNAARFLEQCSSPQLIESLNLPVSNLEGYLFPDTYEIYKPKNEEEVIRKLVGRFKETYTPELMARTEALGLSRNDVVILASVVEKETGKDEERAIIASVFFNRLKKGMPLASDPTIIYGISNFSGNLTRNDLASPGPYNSYLNPGLPPTPISNPGLKSIRAVLYPAETEYYFFVSKNDGTHYFSRTEVEHANAVRTYQKPH